jgi:uncharacterized protein
LDILRDLWELRRESFNTRPSATLCTVVHAQKHATVSPELWENTLGALVSGAAVESELAKTLERDPGLEIFRFLAAEARASAVVGTLPFTGRLLLLSLGEAAVRALLHGYWDTHRPHAFGSDEAIGFAAYLKNHELEATIPFLREVLAFDLAAIAAITQNRSTSVALTEDPQLLFGALAARQLPDRTRPGRYFADISTTGIIFRND